MSFLRIGTQKVPFKQVHRKPKIAVQGSAVNIARALDKTFPQIRNDGSANYVYLGGLAVKTYMEIKGEERKLSDIDIFKFKGAEHCPPHNYSYNRTVVELFPGVGPFGIKITNEDVAILEHNGIEIALLRPEHLLMLKTCYLPRKHDLADVIWILKNMELNESYYNSLLERESMPDLSLSMLLSLRNNNSALLEYISSITLDPFQKSL